MGKQTAGTATAERQTDRRTARRRVFTEKIPELIREFSEPQYYVSLKIPQ